MARKETVNSNYYHLPTRFLIEKLPIFTISYEIQLTDKHIPNIMSPRKDAVEIDDNNGLVP